MPKQVLHPVRSREASLKNWGMGGVKCQQGKGEPDHAFTHLPRWVFLRKAVTQESQGQ
jgi:hypothetical protein